MFQIVSSGSFTYRGGLLALVFSVLVVLCALPTGAQSRDSTAQRLEAIRVQMDKGQALYVTGNYAAAAEAFEAGYKSHPYSAFLFNAGVCYQKLNDVERALEKFREYLRIDPAAPDAPKVKQRIEALEAARSAVPEAGVLDADAGADAAIDVDGGVATEAGAPIVPLPIAPDDENAMKSLVVIETEPQGAPIKLYEREIASAAPFILGRENPGWKEIAVARSPANLTLDVGRYHIVVEKFRDFNVSQADIDVRPGHVHQFKANLSQGEFMAFLRVAANVTGAYVYVDDPKKTKPAWGLTPHGELVPGGEHTLLVEAPGFEPLLAKVQLSHGEQKEMEVKLTRVQYGFLRISSNATEIKIKVDEQPKGRWRVGEQPLDVRLSSGQHRLVVTSSGRKTYDGVVEVPRGQVLPLHVKMIPKHPRGAAWTQAIVGAAFLGAAVYFGTESDRLHDELKDDRKLGVVEEEDSRISRGRWFAVGANGGFAIAGVLGVLATYNFIKDPLPESSAHAEKPVEFDDPRKKAPLARALMPRRALAARKPEREPAATLGITPLTSQNQGSLVIGGTF